MDEHGNVLCQPILGESAGEYLEKTASITFKPSNLHPTIQRLIKDGTINKSEKGLYVLVSALGAAEYWGSNVNGDAFPEKALIHSPSGWNDLPVSRMKDVAKDWAYGYPTFMNAYPYKHHVNKDPSRAFGHVVLAVWNPKMFRVELVVYLDKALCKKHSAEDVYERIENGEFPDVSMGCKVPYDRCSICDHKSKTQKDYCYHAKYEMNKIYPDGRKVCVINDFPRFFDISFVFIGADKSAKMLAKLAQVNNMVCMGDYCAIPRLSADIGEKYSAPTNPLDGLFQKTAGAVWNAEDEFLLGITKLSNDPIKEKVDVGGVPVWIEWKKGETRQYKDKAGKVKYRRLMKHHYGYIPDTKDADGEEIDVYVGPKRDSKKAWVIKQLKADGKTFDENKVMLGFGSKEEAEASYDHHMGGTKERFGGIEEVPTSALITLFGSNGDGKEKKASCACNCGGTCGGMDKVAEGFGQKYASHSKLSEITKIVPAGPFRKAMLPKLEKAEGELPKQALEEMAKEGMTSAISTSASLGIVLKPEEFQHLILIKIGEAKLADQLHADGVRFAPSSSVDDTFAVFDTKDVSEKLASKLLPYVPGRSIAGPILEKRAYVAQHLGGTGRSWRPVQNELLDKIAELYNGYRQDLVKKASLIDRTLVFNPHLSSAICGESLVTAFAGGNVKIAHASVLGPESLAYLVGAHYENREFHHEALTQSGVLAAA